MNNIKKSIILHPFLFAIFPVIFTYSNNTDTMSLNDIVLPLSLVIITSLFFWFVIRVGLKNGIKAGMIVSLVLVVFFSYGHFYNLIVDSKIGDLEIGRHRFLIIPFIFSVIIGIWYFIKTTKILNNATSITNVVSIAIIAVILLNVIIFNNENFFSSFEEKLVLQDHITPFVPTKLEKFPDVYYIILDEYPGINSLKNDLGYDNQNFVDFLTNKGFYVYPQSYSNYPVSISSIPATMDMMYLNYIPEKLESDSEIYSAIKDKYLNNKVMQNFKSLGYKIINFNTFALVNEKFENIDLGLCDRQIYIGNVLLDTTLRTSIIGYFVERWSEDKMRETVLCTFDELPKIKEKFEEPVFVYAHILLPHPPYIFGPNGESITPGKPYLLAGQPEGTRTWDSKEAFLDQVKFATKETEEIVNKLTVKEDKPIIIIQSDHGSGFDVNWKNPNGKMINQRLSNFDALYLPEKNDDVPKDSITTVNTFRIIFNLYFGANYELLPDKMYWVHREEYYRYQNVTDILIQN